MTALFSESSPARARHFTFLNESGKNITELESSIDLIFIKKLPLTKIFFATANHRIYLDDLGLKIAIIGITELELVVWLI